MFSCNVLGRKSRTSSGIGRIWMACVLLGILIGATGCPSPPPPPTSELTIKSVQITEPTGGIFNESNDSDKATPGVQVTVKVVLTTEGTGDFPSGVKAELSTNNKRVAPLDNITSTNLTFENYTLEEGANTLQVKVTLADGTVLNSNAVLVTADSKCYDINIISPKDGTLLGARDDENANKPELQQTVVVQVSKDAVEPVTLTIRDENGKETTVDRKPFDGEVAFDEVTLPNGAVTLIASIEDGGGNKCQAQSKLTVRVSEPAVEITSPTADKLLCPADDKDPNTNDFQVDVTVKTSAEDKSEATLFLDGRKLNTTVISNGEAVFQVTLPALQAEFSNTLKASVTDTLGNTGESKDVEIKGRSSGYTIQLIGALDGQTIPPAGDKDPNKPGIQFEISILTSAPDGTDINLTLNGNKLTQKAQSGKAVFVLDLQEGDNCIEGSVLEADCNIEAKLTKTCLKVSPVGVPTISCSLTEKQARPFNSQGVTDLNPSHDADPNTPGMQNTLSCKSDAEKDQSMEFDLNGTKVNKPLVDGQGGLREVVFANTTFAEGANTITLKVTNNLGKTATKVYKVNVDTTLPSGISDLAAQVVDHRLASVKLTWTVPTDGSGNPAGYEVRYSSLLDDIKEAEWDKPEGKIEIKTSKATGMKDEYTVINLSVLKTYVFAIRAVDAAGNMGPISNLGKIQIALKENSTTDGGNTDELYGANVVAVGDLDKDGFQDIVVSESQAAQGTTTRVGAVHVYYGRAISTGSVLGTTPDVTIYGEGASSYFGQDVKALGDINGDGFADFAVSSFRANSFQGRVYILFGGQRGTSIKNGSVLTMAKVVISGTESGAFFGFSMGVSGLNGQPDLNGDKKADLLVSAPSKTITGQTTKGAVYVFYSRAAYPTGTQPALNLNVSNADVVIQNTTIANGQTGTSSFGYRIVGTDLNLDNKPDLLISAANGDTVVGFFGPLSVTNKIATTSTAQFTIDGSSTGGESFGTCIAPVGDVDKDGKTDLLISAARGQTPGQPSTSGQMFLFSGTKLLAGAKLEANKDAAVLWYGQKQGAGLDACVGVGDLNGDGFSDFMFTEGNAKNPTTNDDNAGAVYVFYGQAKLSNFMPGKPETSATHVWYGKSADTRLGYYALVGGIDFTGDGKVDILMSSTPNKGKSLKGGLRLFY